MDFETAVAERRAEQQHAITQVLEDVASDEVEAQVTSGAINEGGDPQRP